MPSLRNLISSVCRQKRILLLLCTFGTSFIAFNYSLLSSTPVSVIQTPNPFTVRDAEGDGQQRYKESSATSSYQQQRAHLAFLLAATQAQPHNPSAFSRKEDMDKNGTERMPSSSNEPNTIFTKSKSSGESKAYNLISPAITSSTTASTSIIRLHPKRIISELRNVASGKQTNYNTRNVIATVNGSNNNNNRKVLMIGSRFIIRDIPTKTEEDQHTEASTASTASRESIIRRNSNSPARNISNVLGSSATPLPGLSATHPTPQPRESLNNTGRNGGHSENNNDNPTIPYYLRRKSSTRPFHIPFCNTSSHLRRVQKRKKNLTVIENFIMGWKRVKCNESITYTTHGDYRYLDNLVPLVERWNGPISLALYAPGSDLPETLKLISYFKLCTSSKIDEWVTFHLIYDVKYMQKPHGVNYTKPGDISWLDALYQNGKWSNCSTKPSFSKGVSTFRMQNGLLYPINIARNIARFAATTHFVLASDIELYPSINLIPSFMGMLHRLQEDEEERINYTKNMFTAAAVAVAKILFPTSNSNEIREERLALEHEQQLSDHQLANRHVYVLPVFEVKKEISPCQVETKQQLATLLRKNTAVLFHHSICPQCHTFPKFEEWKAGVVPGHERNLSGKSNNNGNSTTLSTMRIFHKAKRKFPFQLWEPIFIGTKEEPIYDERLSWEGLRDKMVSGYVMCVLDYDFYILDSAFLVHKPGIRRVSHLVTKTVLSQDRLINYRIRTELLKKYGKHEECAL